MEETPGAYLDLYKEMRDLLELFTRLGMRGKRHSFSQSQQGAGEVYQSMAGRMSASQLESAGMIDERSPGAARAAERAALVKRVKAGGAREGDLLRYLELCGV